MGSGLGLALNNFSAGTTIASSPMNSNFSSINNSAISNDSGSVTTDGSGHITAANGYLASVIMLTTPYHLTTNPTIAINSTTTLTCTGGSTGVPSGASAVLLGVGVFSVSNQGGSAQIYPAGATAGQWVNFTSPGPTNTYCGGFVVAPLSNGGQITVKASASSLVLQDWYIVGYVN